MGKQLYTPHGDIITGTLEVVERRCGIDGFLDNGEPNYTGNNEYFDDDAKQVVRDGQPIYLDDDNTEWPANQLLDHPPAEIPEPPFVDVPLGPFNFELERTEGNPIQTHGGPSFYVRWTLRLNGVSISECEDRYPWYADAAKRATYMSTPPVLLVAKRDLLLATVKTNG